MLDNPYSILLGALTFLGIGGGAALYFFFPAIAATLISSKLGRQLLLGLLITGGLLLILSRVYNAGKRRVEQSNKEKQLEVLKSRIKTDEKLRRMPKEDRIKEFEQWAR